MHKLTNCSIPVPCGKCPECISKRISGWSFRIMQEYKRCITAEFVTITYDTDHVPITTAGYMSLKKEDIQKFMKRLRKNVHTEWNKEPRDGNLAWFPEPPQIKYYLCGEYGSETNRPHYHAIIFNVPSWEFIESAWQLGAIHYGDSVSEASVGYTLKYMDKPKRIPTHRNDDRQPEFSLMSKGLGENYLTPENIQYHKAALVDRVHLTVADGKKIAMPRYYKDKIYHPLEKMAIKANAAKLQEELLQKRVQKHGDTYYHKKFIMDKDKFRKQSNSQEKRNKI